MTMATAAAATTKAKERWCRCVVVIGVKDGTSKPYKVRRVQGGWEMQTGRQKAYVLAKGPAEEILCSCKGYQSHRHCKHADWLTWFLGREVVTYGMTLMAELKAERQKADRLAAEGNGLRAETARLEGLLENLGIALEQARRKAERAEEALEQAKKDAWVDMQRLAELEQLANEGRLQEANRSHEAQSNAYAQDAEYQPGDLAEWSRKGSVPVKVEVIKDRGDGKVQVKMPTGHRRTVAKSKLAFSTPF